MPAAAHYLIVGCWIIFCVWWLISALTAKAVAEKQSLRSALAHRIPVGLGWWLLILPRVPPPLNWRLLPHPDWLLATGAAACVLGLYITLWARWTLAGNWSSDVTFKQNHELIRRGPYRFVRHPIYTGLLVMGLGTGLAIGQLRCGLSLVVVAFGFWVKLRQEEKLLLRHFPDQYPLYQKQVKALVPFVL